MDIFRSASAIEGYEKRFWNPNTLTAMDCSIKLLRENSVLDEVEFERKYCDEDLVEKVDIDERGKYRATLFKPRNFNGKKRPAVITLHGG